MEKMEKTEINLLTFLLENSRIEEIRISLQLEQPGKLAKALPVLQTLKNSFVKKGELTPVQSIAAVTEEKIAVTSEDLKKIATVNLKRKHFRSAAQAAALLTIGQSNGLRQKILDGAVKKAHQEKGHPLFAQNATYVMETLFPNKTLIL